MIATMLQGCRNATKLDLSGNENASLVMMTISIGCPQLLDLTLAYNGIVTGSTIRTLLQSCPQLTSLTLKLVAPIDLQAYESLALFGGNLTVLRLHVREGIVIQPGSLSFPADSPLYDPDFKQQRKNSMTSLSYELCDLDAKSLAKFLSFFGLIDQLSISLNSFQLAAGIYVKANDDITMYHAHQVAINAPWWSTSGPLDSVFIAIMNSCRSLRHLHMKPQIFDNLIDRATLLVFAHTCMLRNYPLITISYLEGLDMTPFKRLRPKIKLIPRDFSF
jgi:hypothetical protein